MTNKATDKPLTLEQCKNRVARQHGETTFSRLRLVGSEMQLECADEAAELYKDSALEAQKGEIERLKAEIDLLQKANDGLRTNVNLYAFRQRDYPEINNEKTRLAERLNKSSEAYKKLKTEKESEIEALKQALKKSLLLLKETQPTPEQIKDLLEIK